MIAMLVGNCDSDGVPLHDPLKCPKDIGLSVVRLCIVTRSRVNFNLKQKTLYPSISVLPLAL